MADAAPVIAPPAALLETRELTKRFGGYTALHALHLRLAAGQIHAIIGPNGAGKTTCFNLLGGMLRPTTGVVLWRGEDVTGLRPDQMARRGVARTFQNIRLFGELTVLENVMVGCHCRSRGGLAAVLYKVPFVPLPSERAIRRRADELLGRVHLGDARHQPAGRLPYGAQRRVEIARALALEPALLLLDEPAAGMNSAETEELVALVTSINRDGLTIALIEHKMSVVMTISHTVTVLNFGETIAVGPPAAVQQDPQVLEAYLGVDDDDAA